MAEGRWYSRILPLWRNDCVRTESEEWKGSFKYELIKTHLESCLIFPSFLCLDAPLAALGWALCHSIGSRVASQEPLKAPPFAALFLTVWLIYLLDRLLDVERRGCRNPSTLRHNWAQRRTRTLKLLAAMVSGALFGGVLPALDSNVLRLALIPAAITSLYYGVFRCFPCLGRRLGHLPGKEIMIGSGFAIGVLVPVSSNPDGIHLLDIIIPWIALALLFTGNCLLIGRAEGVIDRFSDQSAFYAGRRVGVQWWLPEFLLVFSAGFGLFLVFVGSSFLTGWAIVICAAATMILALSCAGKDTRLIQARADGILLLPWILIFVNFVESSV